MPRVARTVFAGIPHHITQRGNRREDVFFTHGDRRLYLHWLSKYCLKNKVEVLAYCLMTNHVHLVLVPSTPDGLHLCLKPLHMRYAQHVNRKREWNGHLWQGRFFSSPLDDNYTWATIRYVELNPIRAGMIDKAENYLWSSAAAHCGLHSDQILTKNPEWKKRITAIENWSSWLASGLEQEVEKKIRSNVEKGLPCGSNSFISSLERLVGRSLTAKPLGRPSADKKKG